MTNVVQHDFAHQHLNSTANNQGNLQPDRNLLNRSGHPSNFGEILISEDREVNAHADADMSPEVEVGGDASDHSVDDSSHSSQTKVDQDLPMQEVHDYDTSSDQE